MEWLRTLTLALPLGLLLVACAASTSQSAPHTSADPTEGAAPRKTDLPTCRWIPPLPTDREDPCEQMNNGAEPVVTEREGMRPESKTESKHICTCQ